MQGLKGSYGKVATTAAGSFVVERCYNWAVSRLWGRRGGQQGGGMGHAWEKSMQWKGWDGTGGSNRAGQ